LTERCWRNQFQADPSIIGKNLVLSAQSFQVVGVCPQGLNELWPGNDMYVPVNTMSVYGYDLQKRGQYFFAAIARLKEGVSATQAQADLAAVMDNLTARYPENRFVRSTRLCRKSENARSRHPDGSWRSII
jgi:hypothetical protein